MGIQNGKPVLKDADVTEMSKKTGQSESEIREEFEKFVKASPEGRLNKSQFQEYYLKASGSKHSADFVKHVFRLFDANNDGFISFVEFVVILQIIDSGTQQDKIMKLFRVFDINNDGSISKNELIAIFKAIGTANDIRNPEAEALKRISNKVFAEMDADVDGKITKEEFLEASMSGKELSLPDFDEFMEYAKNG